MANINYDDPLVKYRAREVVLEARRRLFTRVEQCDPYILIDSYYIHYSEPIFRKPRDIEDEKLLLWYKVASIYIQSQTYKNIKSMCFGNSKISKILAIRLLKVYLDMLSKVESNREFKNALIAEFKSKSQGKEPSKYIRSIIHRLDYEIKTSISMNIGSLKKVSEVMKKVKNTIGHFAGDEVAEILMDPEDESSRLRLVEMLNSLIELARQAAQEVDIYEREIDVRGFISGLKKLSRIRELRDLTPSEIARANISKELFAYRLATGSLLVHELRITRKPKLYILVDKSGSMFYSVDVKIEDFENLSKITWATALALTLLLKGSKVIVRFFDKKAHEPLQDKLSLVKILLRLTPLGGTSITNALKTAIEDCYRNPNLREYKLILITDGEDSNVDIQVLEKAQKMFKEFIIILVGGENVILEKYCSNVIKLKSIGLQTLKTVLKRV